MLLIISAGLFMRFAQTFNGVGATPPGRIVGQERLI
jgi:hypothetical protein